MRRHGRQLSSCTGAIGLIGVLAAFAASPAQGSYPGPNGRIAYASGTDAAAEELTTILPNGTDVDTLTSNAVEDAEPNYFADGLTLAFERIDGDSDIFTIPALGGAEDEITTDPSTDDDADPSPNGNKFAFESDRGQGFEDDEVYTMNLDGSNVKRLTKKGDNNDPRWSPDGRMFVFVSDRDGDDEIFVMTKRGEKETQLTKNNADDIEPEWSPNGRKIVFNSDRAGGDDEIVRMKADGTKQKLLTDNDDEDDEADFSPDGTRIVFESDRDGDDDIWTMSLSGGSLDNVTDNDGISDDAPDWGVAIP